MILWCLCVCTRAHTPVCGCVCLGSNASIQGLFSIMNRNKQHYPWCLWRWGQAPITRGFPCDDIIKDKTYQSRVQLFFPWWKNPVGIRMRNDSITLVGVRWIIRSYCMLCCSWHCTGRECVSFNDLPSVMSVLSFTSLLFWYSFTLFGRESSQFKRSFR